jgi:hypothetical protein
VCVAPLPALLLSTSLMLFAKISLTLFKDIL